MKKVILLLFCTLILISILFSDEVVTTKDGKKVLLNDNKTWEYVEETKTLDIRYAEDAVTVWDSTLLRTDGKYGKKALGLFIHYQNNTDKKVIGIQVKVSIINPFGKVIIDTTYDVEAVLQPNEKQKSTSYWEFEDNQFIDNEPYDKLWQMADNGTAKIITHVLKVIFDDGKILTAKPKGKK